MAWRAEYRLSLQVVHGRCRVNAIRLLRTRGNTVPGMRHSTPYLTASPTTSGQLVPHDWMFRRHLANNMKAERMHLDVPQASSSTIPATNATSPQLDGGVRHMHCVALPSLLAQLAYAPSNLMALLGQHHLPSSRCCAHSRNSRALIRRLGLKARPGKDCRRRILKTKC